ncbi:hypothetical protein AFK68_29720 [Hydrocoleum sp. CS-953]|nr:hypothetical protein AFK68_29720 [Hydrocoleum sp. CS-953]
MRNPVQKPCIKRIIKLVGTKRQILYKYPINRLFSISIWDNWFEQRTLKLKYREALVNLPITLPNNGQPAFPPGTSTSTAIFSPSLKHKKRREESSRKIYPLVE